MKAKNSATLPAILAAALYAINIPLSKILLQSVEPTMMAAFLYLGAGAGLWLLGLATGAKDESEPLTGAELPYTIGMVVLRKLSTTTPIRTSVSTSISTGHKKAPLTERSYIRNDPRPVT